MIKIIYGIALAITLLTLACSNKERNISTDEPLKNDDTVEIEMPHSPSIIISNTDIIIYPLRLNKGNYTDYSRNTGANYWNIIFNNVITGKSDLLTHKKILINHFKIGNNENQSLNRSLLSNQFIYYEITDSDSDGDKKLTSKDLNKLFISNLEGKAFTQISPKNYSVHSWKIDSDHNLILLDLIKDTNGDKEFNDKDEIEYFVYNLKTGVSAKPVFEDAFKTEVKALAKKIL
ncbi:MULTISPECIES: hypothetical protein [unclassified Pedobacter]|uniref:hypothetical protein n=1 Tax=unclassified Pedobacter TaxID=2628915 RepID=UPI001E3CA480|nr:MULTISPECIES: hypothetical protein [unclassified Pedobacter]